MGIATAPNHVRVRFIYRPHQQTEGMVHDQFLGCYYETDVLPDVDPANRMFSEYYSVMIIKELPLSSGNSEWVQGEYAEEVTYDGTTLYIHAKTYGRAYAVLQGIIQAVTPG